MKNLVTDVVWNREMDHRPCLILAYVDSAFAARWGRHLRRAGWAVHLAASAAEARVLLSRLDATALILDEDVGDEPASVLAERLSHDFPGLEVLLVGPTPLLPDGPAPQFQRLSRQDDPERALVKLGRSRLALV